MKANALRTPGAQLDVLMVLPNLEQGGAERVSVNLANAWAERGLAVELALLHGAGPLAAEVAPAVAVTAFEVVRSRQAIVPLARRLSQRRPRAILAAMPPSTWVATAARAWAGSRARLAVAEHFDWSGERNAPPNPEGLGFKLQTRAACRLADVRIAVSAGVAETLARIAHMPLNSIDVVYNPVTPLPPDGDTDHEIMNAWRAAPGAKLISVGSFKGAKDLPTLFRAIAKMRQARPVSLLLLGDGGLRPELEGLRASLALQACVHMPGFVPNPQAYLRHADLYLLSSTAEGLPTVIVEALACGVPVVSTDCRSGPREILEDGKYGALVPTHDADALAKAGLDALARAHDRTALERRSQDFSVDAAADRYLQLLLPDWAQAPTREGHAA